VATPAGVALAVENVDGTPAHELAALMAGLSREQAGVCFDSSHATYGGDLSGELAQLAPYIIGTHLSDNDGLPGGAWTDRHWRPFAGTIDWPRLVQEIVERSPCDCLTLEVLDRENPRVSDELMASCRCLQALAARGGFSLPQAPSRR
jgi:sugar phosphate isomerase/epimerase